MISSGYSNQSRKFQSLGAIVLFLTVLQLFSWSESDLNLEILRGICNRSDLSQSLPSSTLRQHDSSKYIPDKYMPQLPEIHLQPLQFQLLCAQKCPKYKIGVHFKNQLPAVESNQLRIFCGKCTRPGLNDRPKPLRMEYWPETDDTLEIPKSIAFNIPPFEQIEDRFVSMKNNLTDYFSSSTAYNYRTRKITTQKIEQEEKLKEKLTLNETLSRWKWYSENWNSEKYFHESTGRPGLQDSRYVVKLPTREGNWKRETEIELIDAWLELAETNGILTWMAHGTLLSWFWGRSLFPWDKDSDFQIDASQLPELWKLNNTFTDNGRFFLDINPNSVYRTYNRQDVNRIDARVIDTLTGMYLDITALSKSKPNFKWVYCKSPHYYSYEDIYPLSLTVLEGIKILRPNKVVEMLEKEYKVKGTTIPYWRDGVTRGKVYYWDDAFLEWTLRNPGGINGSLGQNDGQPPQRRMIV